LINLKSTGRFGKNFAAFLENMNCSEQHFSSSLAATVKLGNKERFDKEQIGIKEPYPVTNLPFTS
jgi:hypothetical protein